MPNQIAPDTDFEALDEILDLVELIYGGLIHSDRILKSQIERWRWDVPSITLTWLANDWIFRNINSYVSGELGQKSAHLFIEGNAWVDQDVEEPKLRVRRWHHEELPPIKVEHAEHQQMIEETVFEAYRLVMDRGYQGLENQEVLGSL